MNGRVARLLPALLLCSALAAEQPDLRGSWSGSILATDRDEAIEFEIELTRNAEGRWSGVRITENGTEDLTAVAVENGEVRFTVGGNTELTGTLSADGDSLAGTARVTPPPPPPGSDVHLVPLARSAQGWRLGAPQNVTDRDGYDNQPRFLPGASAFLYTSIRDGQADIYLYDVAAAETRRLTDTVESEYSPTPLPSALGFSTVRVEADGTQRLWGFDTDGRNPQLLLPDVQPVGYHGWLSSSRLGLFVLGAPPTLQLAELGLSEVQTVAESIGRSIHLTPDGGSLSFIAKHSDSDWSIDLLDLESSARRRLIETRPGNEDFTWLPDGQLLMGDGARLYTADPRSETPQWEALESLSGNGLDGITRLDVSDDGHWLALVAARPASAAVPAAEERPFRLSRDD